MRPRVQYFFVLLLFYAVEVVFLEKPCQKKSAPYNAPSSTDEMSGCVERQAKIA